jgi:hypothetical protein
VSSTLSREEQRELRSAIAHELLSDVANATPELDDERLSYVTVQIDRKLWLQCRNAPRPPYVEQPTE